ncbi:DegV family protein [Candidatus Phytoplasma melaleucae]|uniref:DegV family EDD domain-containing protein n=1 Tax=Candidatus Phytoplasma melaleucae TaxID=2982630 RepID=A0ABT9DDM8_9MOLU|nr:DegV family protein ['Melaleuca sp.' phytoplasma]MDO8168134.1 DegV family EDD domain-containing protein ['Melaleuca sp.' phytoplasma]MDV3205238.1 DegV family protein [Weeping tea tree witches'-broom phytoplasma]
MKKRKLGIVVDSTIGKTFDQNLFPDMSIVPLTIILNDKVYDDGNINNQELLTCLKKGHKITTSHPNPYLFIEAFKKQFELGYEHVVCLTLTQKFSATFNSAQKAQQMLNNANITVIDTENIGPGMFFTLSRIHYYIYHSDLNYPEIFAKVKQEQKNGSIFFSLNDLNFLASAKRISRFKYFLGSVLLKIKTILKLNQGTIFVKKNVRSWKNCFQFLLHVITQLKQTKNQIEVKIVYVNDDTMAKELQREINALNDSDIKVSIFGEISSIFVIHIGSEGFGFYLNKI